MNSRRVFLTLVMAVLCFVFAGCGDAFVKASSGASGSGKGSGPSNPPLFPPSGSGGSGGTGGSGGSGGSGGGGSTAPVQLHLLAANVILAGVTVPDAVWADANYVYLASFDGRLRVIDKKQSTFPVIGDVPAAFQLFSVRGDSSNVYATANAGTLLRFSNQPPFTLLAATSYSANPLTSLDVDQPDAGAIIVAQQTAQSAADAAHVYLTSLNPGDSALGISKATGQLSVTYQEDRFDATVTAVFDRSGARVGTIQNPPTATGMESISIYSQAGVLALFSPGCCGRGVFLYNASTLAPLGGAGWIFDLGLDSVAVIRNWLIVGTERGTVDVYDIGNRAGIQPDMAPIASINLRIVTGKTGPEDIEVRAIWTEDTGDKVRIYAGSTWGSSNLPASYRAQLPSFFVLDLK